jgi:hypothetical protein
MIPQANITAWRASAPWPDDAQVEQDLVLSSAVVHPAPGYLISLFGKCWQSKLHYWSKF